MSSIEDNKELFKKIVSENIKRDGIDKLMRWLETTDFYTSPASTRFHGSEPGGLCAHSLAVYDYLKSFQEDESDESIAIAALFHDLCKANLYKVSMRNTKDENGKWIQVPYYETDFSSVPLGHGEKSLYHLSRFIKLSLDEALAIRWHMASYYAKNPQEDGFLNAALEQSKLVLKLQTADSAASFWSKK